MTIPALAFFGVELLEQPPSKTIENPQTIGEHLRKRRLELKLLQKDVAKIMEVSEDGYRFWEIDKTVPLYARYPKIIQFLGYNPFPRIDTSTLGGKIANYRIENGLSQEDLAILLGVNESTIYAWEKNEHIPLASKKRLLDNLFTSKELLS